MIQIPKQYNGRRLMRLRKNSKKPIELNWNTINNYCYDSPVIKYHLQKGENYGIALGPNDDNSFDFVIDDDEGTILTSICLVDLPNTFQVRTRSGKNHFYYTCKELIKKTIFFDNEKHQHLGELQSKGQYVVAANSIVDGKTYEVVNDVPIAEVTREQIEKTFEKYINSKLTTIFNENIQITPIGECKFLDYCIVTPLKKGARHSIISKNIAVYIFNKPNMEQLKNKYISTQRGNPKELDNWLAWAREGKIKDIICGKLINYQQSMGIPLMCKGCSKFEAYKWTNNPRGGMSKW